MSNKETGGPAFPSAERVWCTDTNQYIVGETIQGMTVRDYFAAKAVSGLMGRNWTKHKGSDADLIAIWAGLSYAVADALLEARKTKP